MTDIYATRNVCHRQIYPWGEFKMRIIRTLSLSLLFAALVAAPSSAQQSTAAAGSDMLTSDALDAAVAGHETAVDQQRAELADLLSRDQVRDVARDRGIDMGRVESAAAGLTDAQVTAISPLVATVATAQEGGGGLGSVTISVVALIVILLILILVT